MTNWSENHFATYLAQIIELLGSFLLKILHTVYANLTIWNVVSILLKYLPLIVMERYIRYTYREVQKSSKLWNAEKEAILLELDVVNANIASQEEEFRVGEETLRSSAQELHLVRAQVRQMIAGSDNLRQQLNLPVDFLHVHVNNTCEEDSKLFEELIKESIHEEKQEPVDEQKSFEKNTINLFNSKAIYNNDEKSEYTIKIVEVTNVFKMSYLRHYLKHKRLQEARHDNLKKKTNNTRKLFNEWHQTLNAVTTREYAFDIGSDGTVMGEAIGNHKSYDMLHTNEEREPYQDYEVPVQNQCLTNGNYGKDMAPEGEATAIETSEIYDNRLKFIELERPVLSVLPEETRSQIEMDRLDVH